MILAMSSRLRTIGMYCVLQLVLANTVAAIADEPQWIWWPNDARDRAPAATRFFRKTFEVESPVAGRLEITCDDSYRVSLNGKELRRDGNWTTIESIDVSAALQDGTNLMAVECTNGAPGSAGLWLRMSIEQSDGTKTTVVSDATWLSHDQQQSGWRDAKFSADGWANAVVYGTLEATSPWKDQVRQPGQIDADRFVTAENVAIDLVAMPEMTGTLIAMTFDEQGNIIASREKGPLILLRDEDGDGRYETVTTFCDEMNFCQGILVLEDRVLAVGNGPDGTGMYRLRDTDQDGKVDEVKLLIETTVKMQDHGPHVPVLGPDGFVYLLMGNFANPVVPYSETSPHRIYYEGDLNLPRYEDSGGHAVGKTVPGGKVMRTDVDGSFLELVCGGFRNPYDIAFDRTGELFTYDADMEFDDGMPWYRLPRINHIVPGAEFGWRSGWAKWPPYYLDSLPAVIDVGRGSPTGITFYHHHRFPEKYRDALLLCDWASGVIWSAQLQPQGGSYTARLEKFIEGKPLNVTDIEVGPDGWIYFCTGGRNTEGGIYRARWTGASESPSRREGVWEAIDQEQPSAAWARRRVREIREQHHETWESQLQTIASDTNIGPRQRLRAIDLLQQFGPQPQGEWLRKLTHDASSAVRAKAVDLLALHAGDKTAARLAELLADEDPRMRRKTCEAFVRGAMQPPHEPLLVMLDDDDRFVAWAARRALERIPADVWSPAVLSAASNQVFLRGSAGLLIAAPQEAPVDAIVERCQQLLADSNSNKHRVDALRVIELAVVRSELSQQRIAELRETLNPMYPTGDAHADRELIRLLVRWQAPELPNRFAEQIAGDLPLVEKVHIGTHAPRVEKGWNDDARATLLTFYQQSLSSVHGRTADGYIRRPMRDLLKAMPEEDRPAMLASCAAMDDVAMELLQLFSKGAINQRQLAAAMTLDRARCAAGNETSDAVAAEIVAVVGRSNSDRAVEYLHQIFESYPERRQDVARALAAQALDGQRRQRDFELLLRSLLVVEGKDARLVVRALNSYRYVATAPRWTRHVLLTGLRLGKQGGDDAIALLRHFNGEDASEGIEPLAERLAAWQDWFREKYPDLPDPSLPAQPPMAKWTYGELLTYLESDPGDSARGPAAFEKAQCVKCHRFASAGSAIGPDLTTVARRFQRKEILQSVLFPSQVISDQFGSKTIVTNDGLVITGMMGVDSGEEVVVLPANGEKVTIAKSDIDTIEPSNVSAMPQGLLDPLSREEIAALFAYLLTPPQ